MKKLYILSLMLLNAVVALAQTVYSENMGPGSTSPNPSNPTVTVYTGLNLFQNGTSTGITYSGNATVRTSNGSMPVPPFSGGANVFFSANSTQDFTITGINTSTYPTNDLVLTFALRQDATNTTQPAPATSLVVEKSTDGTNWVEMPYTRTTASSNAWETVTINGGMVPSSPALSLRFRQNGATASRLDDVKIAVVSAACTFAFGLPTSACNAVTENIDDVIVTVPFSGAGMGPYNVTAAPYGTIQLTNNPNTAVDGNFQVTLQEGYSTTVTVTYGTCSTTLDITGSTTCKPVNTLPLYDAFNYSVGSNLTSSQRWWSFNTGDSAIVTAPGLSYGTMMTSANAVTFSGAGAESWTPFTGVSSGPIYVAFLLNVADMANVTVDGTTTYFMGLTNGTTTGSGPGYLARLFIKKNADQYQLAFTTASASTDATVYSPSYNVGTTMMILLSYDYAGNMLNMWTNPNLDTFNPATTTPTLTETPATAITTPIAGLMLRQDGANNTPTIVIDELRVATDMATLSTGRNNAQIDGLSIYPNPLSGNVLHVVTPNNTEKAVAIYDVLGKQVVNTLTTETVNVSGLNSGVYIVKITEGGNTATKKLIIK